LAPDQLAGPARAKVKVNTRPGDAPLGDLAQTVRAARQASGLNTPLAAPDRYAESRELGRGGMGRVIEATDRLLGRRVAVKQMLGSGDHGLRRRFDQEALVTAQVDHPGIPTVFERATGEDGKPYYTMRLIEGETMAQRLRAAQSLPERLLLLPALLRVAQTLCFAHAKGVVHRDVKPENVVVGSFGDAVLLDWGIAKVRGLGELRAGGAVTAGPDAGMTAHGAVLGTPA
jgi:serine/threonine protein kinase